MCVPYRVITNHLFWPLNFAPLKFSVVSDELSMQIRIIEKRIRHSTHDFTILHEMTFDILISFSEHLYPVKLIDIRH